MPKKINAHRGSRTAPPRCWPKHADDAVDLDDLLVTGEMVLSAEPMTPNYMVAIMTHVAFIRHCITKRTANAAGEVRRNAVTSTGLLADESKGGGQ